MPLYRRIPRRGFSNYPFKEVYAVVNVGSISKVFENGADVDAEALRKKRLVKGKVQKIKVLAVGEIDKKITLKVDAVSAAAREKIENVFPLARQESAHQPKIDECNAVIALNQNVSRV